ncbi:MAG: hypothetical protein ACI4HM_00840, partial [Ruminococcus sp.]
MSDNRKPPYDDDKTRIFNLNDDEKTKSFRIDDRGLNDDERDFFSDDPVEDLNTFATKKIDLGDKSSYNDDFNLDLPTDKEGVSVYNDNFDNFSEEPYERSDRPNRERKPVSHKNPSVKSKRSSKKSKKPVVVGVVCVAVAIIVVVVILLVNGCSNNKTPVDTSTTETTTQTTAYTSENATYAEDTTYIETTAEETTEPTTEETTEEETTQPPTTQKPTIASMFDASFAPYKCITPEGEVVSDDFNSVFGGDASVSFTSGGSYTLAVGTIANSSGSYTVDGNYLGMDGYSGTVNFDDAGNPVAVIISV